MENCENQTVEEVVDSFAKENKQEGLRVFVAGGSRSGNDDIYIEEAYNLGKQIAKMDFKLDFGLSSSGIMGAVARGVLDRWNKQKCTETPIQGITTKEYYSLYQSDEILSQVEDIIVAQTLEERKQKLLNADFVVFAPGGVGTLDELAYVQLSDVDTITNTVENPAGYPFKLEDLLDNNPSTSWTASDSYTEARTHEITIELKEPKAIKGLKFAQPLQPLSWAGSYFPVSAIVTVSPDGISWSNLAYVEESIIGGGAGEVTLIPAADPKDIKFIRIEMTDVTDLYNSGYTITIGDIIPYY